MMVSYRTLYKPSNAAEAVKIGAALIAIGISLFHLYTGAFGIIQAYALRTIHLLTLMTLVFLFYPFKKGHPEHEVQWVDILLALACIGIDIYLFYHNERITTRELYVDELPWGDLLTGGVMLLLLLEATRRVSGPALPIVSIFFMAYVLGGQYLPYPLTIRSPNIDIFIEHMYLSPSAIFGVPLGTSATFVFLFILFAAMLESTGAGKFIIDLCMSAVGGSTGGPAKVAVTSSCLFGCVSGHSVANVYGTGTFTIPLMKKAGYDPTYAGAVEAAASTGGQLMPPIMGAAAFIMAELVGISYLEVCTAALVPALLYFLGLFAATHFRARKLGLGCMPKSELPNMRQTLKDGCHFIIPLVVLVWVLVLGYTPFRAAFIAIITLLGVAYSRRSSRLSFQQLLSCIVSGARNAVTIAACCGCAGIIVGALDITGIALKFVDIMMLLSGGNFWLTLILVMVACIILGMGIPTAPAYIIVSIIAAPALINMGIVPIAAHMFVFYACLLSAITPPVGLAAYAGAAIAGAPIMKTCIQASVLGFIVYIIPYIFVTNPALLLQGGPLVILMGCATATIGVICLTMVFEGYGITRLNPIQMILLGVGGIFLLISEATTDMIGIALIAIGMLMNWRSAKCA